MDSHVIAKQIDGRIIEIHIKNGLIVDLSNPCLKKIDDNLLPWITSGLFDIQVNGSLGTSFNDPFAKNDDIIKAVSHCVSHGMTKILATLITNDSYSIIKSLELIERARKISLLCHDVIGGYHIEGPAISPQDGFRGAHPKEHIRVPSINEYEAWKAASNNRIKIVTVAPEMPGVLNWISQMVHDGITVAIGHTNANFDQIKKAVSAGAKLSTHLGNGCASLVDRHNNPLWCQLAEDGLISSLIIDGRHLSEAFVRTVFKCKKPGKIILTSDCSPLAGLPSGNYSLWNKSVEIDSTGNVLIPNTSYLAGSGHFLNHCVETAMKMKEWDDIEILKAASCIPRKIIGLKPSKIAKGYLADFVLWEGRSLICSKVQKVCVSGRWFQ